MVLLSLAAALQSVQPPGPSVYAGREQQLRVPIPRIEARITVDGTLSETVWSRAALLTGFSQYRPADGRPADDSTEVLVWYSPTAIHFGIRAFESHGGVIATLADRDRIDTDDYVQILLDTFNDRRRALVFGVNPLGVQSDGVRSEGIVGAAGGPGAGGVFENVDLNPDFVFQSRGRVTEAGYEVEMRIPFKSLRYQTSSTQAWGINVLRKVQHSQYENTWTPVLRANASFLAQSGTLEGLTGLQRGLVLDVNPFATARVAGTPAGPGWTYDATPEAGLNARWGITTNLTLDGTVNPDFSQVEADVGQVTVNERFALFFPEKRPFFLEGIEQFDVPNQLIYTRRIRSPAAGIKLTGKASGTNIGLLSSVDDTTAGGDRPIITIARIRRDLGGNSTAGIAYTDRVEGDDYNRVAAADARIVFGKLYFFEAQVGASVTRAGGVTTRAPLWQAAVDRTGRSWGFHYTITGFHPDFAAANGFVPRTGIVAPFIVNRFTAYGRPGATLETVNTFVLMGGFWDYREFLEGADPREVSVEVAGRGTLRGGWTVSATPRWQSIAFDPAFYGDYRVARAGPAGVDTIAFDVPGRVSDAFDAGIRVGTPRFQALSAGLGANVGKTVAFFEPARATVLSVNASVDLRPTDQMRWSALFTHLRLSRERDGSRLSTASIPRLKVEYQLARPLFVRFVGQYSAQRRDALRDPRTDEPILVRDGETGVFVTAARRTTNDLRMDWLLSYRPNPGTVVFAGYGSSLTATDAFTFRDLERVSDGFFFKLSYLLRL